MRGRSVAAVAGLLLMGACDGSPMGPVAAIPASVEPAATDPSGDVQWPVDGDVLRRFEAPATRFGAGHRGVDLAAEPGQEVRAALGGIVVFAGLVAGSGWVTVDHGNGLVTTYGVLGSWDVDPGVAVAAGERLGRLAPSATHLDWGARRDGAYIDPLSLFGRWRVRLVDR
jgi:murein DD-endopeptidase MepM/ murein hydrolase activator NlpD